MKKQSKMRKPLRRRAARFLRSALLAAACAFQAACGSDLAFTRFEIGRVDGEAVLKTAVETVRDYYTQVHGGLHLFVDEENLRFETGYIQDYRAERSEQMETAEIAPMPRRQRLFCRVIPFQDRVEIELFATIEVMSLEDLGAIKDASDLWRFIRQDREVEQLLYSQIMARLIDQGLIPE